MNPIILAGLHGFVKGAMMDKAARVSPDASTTLAAPVLEELAFRAPLHGVAPGFADFMSAVGFGLAHVDPRAAVQKPSWAAFRGLDAFAGGLVYAAAFRQFGIFGAVAAHALHNVAISAGQATTRRPIKKGAR
jgi:membrane protease YdiL (CAAX protease family)